MFATISFEWTASQPVTVKLTFTPVLAVKAVRNDFGTL